MKKDTQPQTHTLSPPNATGVSSTKTQRRVENTAHHHPPTSSRIFWFGSKSQKEAWFNHWTKLVSWCQYFLLMLWPNYQVRRKQRNEMKPGEIKSLRKCYCSFVTPECKGSRMDGRRWWKMALQTTRESLIEREGRSVLLRAHSFKGFGCFT